MTEQIQLKKERLTQEIAVAKTALKQGGCATILSSLTPDQQNGQDSHGPKSSISSTIIDMMIGLISGKDNPILILSKLL